MPGSKSQVSINSNRTNLVCKRYGKNHKGECMTDSDMCFGCGKLGHRVTIAQQVYGRAGMIVSKARQILQ